MSDTRNPGSADISDRYARAAAFLPERMAHMVRNTDFEPVWLAGEDRFWYRRDLANEGHAFVLVDAASGRAVPAFDHEALAGALTQASGLECDPGALPFAHFSLGEGRIGFTAFGADWDFDPASGVCRRSAAIGTAPHEVPSPDAALVAFVREHDLWVRDRRSGDERRLTADGRSGCSYAKSPDGNTAALSNRIAGIDLPAAVIWSADSRRLVTHRLDERRVPLLHYLQSVPAEALRPIVHPLHVAFPSDAEIPMQTFVILDALSGHQVALDIAPICASQVSSIEAMNVWWSADGRTVFLLDMGRANKSVRLFAADSLTGASRLVLQETAETFLELNQGAVHDRPLVRDLENGREILWFSQKDGWGHLYLHDGGTGALINRVTSGRMLVRAIHHIDASARLLYFSANGPDVAEDPYRRALYRVSLDGSGLHRLTPNDADQHVSAVAPVRPREFRARKTPAPASGVSDSGRYFVASASRTDLPQTASVYRADGTLVAPVETADIEPLRAIGWHPPEPFVVLAADGKTRLHGALFKPTDFDPSRIYPVLDYIYPGPQLIQVPKRCLSRFERRISCFSHAMAELGMIVVTVDGRGTPFRSKAYHDAAYLTQDNPGNLDDHVAALSQLANIHPYLDLDRVGLMGHSGGALASMTAMLRHPEVFKAAACSSGNYDYRGYHFWWGEKYMGPMETAADGSSSYDGLDCTRLASRLAGKLLLGFGDMDDNVHWFQSSRLVSALISANKDFELVLVPGANHESIMAHPYWLRRMMDFFVRELIGEIPPREFDLGRSTGVL